MSELHEDESEFARLTERLPCDDGPRAEHRDALRMQALAAFDTASRSSAAGLRLRRAINQGRQFMRRPIPRIVALAAACLAVAALWLLVPGSQSTAQAFNKFAEAIVTARSATFHMDVQIVGQEKQTFQSYYLAPSRYRNEMKMGISIMDTEAGKIVMLMPTMKRAMIMNMKNVPPDKRQSSDMFQRLRELLAESRDAKDEQYKRVGEKEIDGRKVVGFRYESTMANMTMWGDPETGLPVLVESDWTMTQPVAVTMKDFKFNVDLQPALFDTTPPADYMVQSFDFDASTFTEADLVRALKLMSEGEKAEFPDTLDMAGMSKVIMQAMTKVAGKNAPKPVDDVQAEAMRLGAELGRGLGFIASLPKSSDAHYAGKGVKRGTPDRPICWYKPPGKETYRVIYADLTVQDADKAPDVPGAMRLEKAALSGALPAAPPKIERPALPPPEPAEQPAPPKKVDE